MIHSEIYSSVQIYIANNYYQLLHDGMAIWLFLDFIYHSKSMRKGVGKYQRLVNNQHRTVSKINQLDRNIKFNQFCITLKIQSKVESVGVDLKHASTMPDFFHPVPSHRIALNEYSSMHPLVVGLARKQL